MLECVINISEGRDGVVLAALARAAGDCLLDVHRDPDHHRSVFTLAGEDERVEGAARALAAAVVERVDLSRHAGVHPRIGALDVVPFVALEGNPVAEGPPQRALVARDEFMSWAADELDLPCFAYGPERSLPELRRAAWKTIEPDAGPGSPHPTAGAAAVGARPVLVAYNLWLATPDLAQARQIARDIRGPQLRTLGLQVGREVQVSCNLVAPWQTGPAAAYDAVARRAGIARAELVGLVPETVLRAQPRDRWGELDLDPSTTIEARLAEPPTLAELGLA